MPGSGCKEFGGKLIVVLPLTAGMLPAFSNGANDNFKGVETRYGSGTTSYRCVLIW